MDIVVKIENVTKVYGNQTVLNNVSLICEKGNIYGLVGRNGSGKTVLLKCICGLIHPTSGVVHVWGKQIGKDVDFPESIGAIIEAPGFLPSVSAFRNLSYLASLRGRIGRDEIRAAISFVGLDPDDKKAVGKYSLGMKQRLGLAQAIMEDPDILLLDEPMNGLDNSGVSEMRNYLLQLREKGKTILLISHSIEDINTLCDTVHEMDHGVLTEKEHISSECLDHNLKN